MIEASKRLLRRSKSEVHRLRATFLRRRGLHLGADLKIYGRLRVRIAPGSNISISTRVVLNADPRRNSLEARGENVLQTLTQQAKIFIGEDSGITSSTLSATGSISIGKRVLIGSGVVITDSDHHVVDPAPGTNRRYSGIPVARASDAVVIGDDVFIGTRSVVLKGVQIGARSVIGAGSVVTSDIPPNCVAAGNPCRVVRFLRSPA